MKGFGRTQPVSCEQAIEQQLAETDATIAALQRCRALVVAQLGTLLERRHAGCRQNAEVVQ